MPESRGHIVVVEDDPGLNQALARLLQIAGFTTAAFESAEAALASNALEHAGCVVTDVRLPGMSGFDLHARMAGPRVPPFVIITAHDDAVARQGARAIGAVAYLPKPVEGRALLSAVFAAVRR